MNGRIVNLRTARKQRERAARRKEAAGNAVRFGRSRSETVADKAEVDRQCAHLDQHKRDKS